MKARAAGFGLLALTPGCSLDVVFPTDAPVGGDTAVDTGDTSPAGTDSGETAPGERTAVTPVAPTAGAPMWQGVQEAFLDADGVPCTVPIVAALAQDAFCFVAADDELRCAGRVYTEAFGASFVATGVRGARQIFLSPTADTEGGNAICALTDGALQCFGYTNRWGQLGNGGTSPSAAFTRWGDVSGLVGAATGTWDQLCALDGAGEAWCAGDGYGPVPVSLGGGHGALLVDGHADVAFDDPARWRASAGRSECFVTARGLDCGQLGEPAVEAPVGTPGRVVDGGVTLPVPRRACWLEDDGRAWCGDPVDVEPVFAEQPVLLLAVDPHSDAVCAVYADGSLACRGSDNTSGRFGTGSTLPLVVDTVVAPAGTIDTRCR